MMKLVHLIDAKEGSGDFPKFMSITSYVSVTSYTILHFYREMEKMDSDATYDWSKCTFLWCESWSLNVTWPLLQVV